MRDGKVLLVYYDTVGSIWSLPGGRCDLHEDSRTALKREFMEETGVEVEVTGEPVLVENFFKIEERKYHEILIIHTVEIPQDSDLYTQDKFEGKEGERILPYEWLKISDLKKYPIKPEFLIELIESPGKKRYNIVRDY